MKCAEILSVGTELLLGDIVNTDAAFISRKLAELGIPCYHQSVVGDNAQRLEEELRAALDRSDIVIMTGGLGPTCDDITKNIAAKVFARELYEDADVVSSLKRFFAELGRPMTENNLAQALVPKGAEVLRNDHGTAPGIRITGMVDGVGAERTVILLPGPPRELEPMFTESVAPYLRSISPYTFHSLNLHLYGIGESRAESVLRDIIESSDNPTVAPYACEAEVRVRITARAESRAACEAMCRAMAERIAMSDVGAYVFAQSTSDDDASEVLTRRVIDMLRERGMTVATAESCTAGMISARIADIPGSSDVLEGGVVSYSNEVKMNVLGVPSEIIERHGAVSEPCAAAMAEGVRRLTGASVTVSVTGIAGPGGGSEEKPVGTVCFGISDERGTVTDTMHFGRFSDRGRVRRMTSSAALMKIIERISSDK